MVYTEMMDKKAVFLIQEMFDQYQLLAVSTCTISFSREMNQDPIIGNQEIVY